MIFDRTDAEVAPLVREQVIAHGEVGMVLWERVRLDLDLPVAVLQRGAGGALNSQTYAPPPAGAALGDLRLGVDVRLLGRAHERFTAAAGVQVFAPTGSVAAFTSDGRTRVWPRLMVAGEWGAFVWAARAGYHLRPTGGLAPGDELTGGVGLGWRVSPAVLLGAELYGSSARDAFGKAVATPAEVLVGGHVAVARDWRVAAGVAPGLTDGPGAPTVRFIAALQYWPAVVEPARVPAPAAAIAPRPKSPPPKPTPLPPPPPPPDADGDGVIDAEDACPTEAGERSEDPRKNGCPVPKDRDGDGILDAEDACPDAAGARNPDPAQNGCPIVRIERGQIRIREQVRFKTASARILKESDYILDAVVKVLGEHAEISRLRVEGHTDTQGKPAFNKKLSQRRAASVVKWLVRHGINKRRLTSAGFGQERPLATNNTDDGRRQNRRVEFHIVEGPGAEP